MVPNVSYARTCIKTLVYSVMEFRNVDIINSQWLYLSSAVVFAMVKTEMSTAGIDSTIAISDSERSPLLYSVTK